VLASSLKVQKAYGTEQMLMFLAFVAIAMAVGTFFYKKDRVFS
jgi:hypothetical protein